MPYCFLVYALVDPRDGAWRYIGKSSSGLRRAQSHVYPSSLARNASPHKDNWIRGLLKSGLTYDILVLEESESFQSNDTAEKEWIAAAAGVGMLLTNKTPGGDGKPLGIWHTEEARRKMSKSRKGKSNPSSKTPKNLKRLAELSKTNATIEHQTELARKRGMSPIWDSEGREYETISEASMALGIFKSNIRRIVQGKGYFAKGLSFTSDPLSVSTLKETALCKYREGKARAGASHRRPIVDQYGVRYASISEAGSRLGVEASNISTQLAGKGYQVCGRTFSFAEAR